MTTVTTFPATVSTWPSSAVPATSQTSALTRFDVKNTTVHFYIWLKYNFTGILFFNVSGLCNSQLFAAVRAVNQCLGTWLPQKRKTSNCTGVLFRPVDPRAVNAAMNLHFPRSCRTQRK
jgi:hypothetical protein